MSILTKVCAVFCLPVIAIIGLIALFSGCADQPASSNQQDLPAQTSEDMHAQHNSQNDSKAESKAGSVKPEPEKLVEKATDQYSLLLYAKEPPLKIGEESLMLEIKDLKNHKLFISSDIEVKVLMKTPHEMEAPVTVTVTELPIPSEYNLAIEFLMEGEWIVSVKPTPSDKAIEMKINVQE